MNTALDWQVLSQQWLLTFVHFWWQAAAVGLLLGIALRVCARASSQARYAMSCLALATLPVCVLATFVSVNAFSDHDLIPRERATDEAIVSAPAPELALRPEQFEVPRPFEPAGDSRVTNVNLLPGSVMANEPPVLESSESYWLAWQDQVWAWSPYLMAVYCAGVLVMLGRMGVAVWSSRRLRAAVQPITDSVVLKILAEQATRLRLRQIPLAAICSRVSVPVVVGVLKPMILLPPALLCGMDPRHLGAILAHEMAHIRRYDLVVNLCQRVVEALLFFHPMTWWISRRLRIERENCCDDMAAANAGPLPYASALLQMAELCLGHDPKRSAALAGMSADGGNPTDLGYRIRRLIGAEDPTRIGISRRGACLLVAMIVGTWISLVAWGQNQPPADDMEKVSIPKIFTPEPVWQTMLGPTEGADRMSRISPIVVAGRRVLTVSKDFDLETGSQIDHPFVRPVRDGAGGSTVLPVFRRQSSDRKFIIEVSNRDPGRTFSLPSFTMRVMRARDGKQVGVPINLPGLFGYGCDVDVESGGNFVLFGDRKNVRVYRIETAAVETTLPVTIKRVDAVAFSPDRDWLVVSDRNDLHFWRWRDQAPVKTISVGRKIDYLTFTPDGQYLAEGPDSRQDIQIRDMRTLEIIASLKDEVESPLMVSSMDISPDGRYLVAHNEVNVDPTKLKIPHRIHVWDLKTRRPVFQIATGEWVRCVSFSDDGQWVLGEFLGDAHGALLAAWQLPAKVLHAKVKPPTDAKDRLGDGIQWSIWGDKDGLLSGVRLVLPAKGLKPGQPLVVEYRLANVSGQTKTILQLPNKGIQFTSLSTGNRIGGFGLARLNDPKTVTIEPGGVYIDSKHLVSIDTTGLQPGEYEVALGSAFFYADEADKSITHSIPHRGSVPLVLHGESTATLRKLPKNDIHWGQPVAGLQLGAKWDPDQAAYSIGSTVAANLFVANVSHQPIECSVELPHPGDGWQFNVEALTGSRVTFEQPSPIDYISILQYVHMKLAAGEIARITGDGLRVSMSRVVTDDDIQETSQPKIQFVIVGSKDEAVKVLSDVSRHTPVLTSQGGDYQAAFHATLHRPAIPNLRLELDTANVPFSVIGPERKQDSDKPSRDVGPGTDEKPSANADEKAIRSLKYQLIDGASGAPIENLLVRVGIFQQGSDARFKLHRTDQQGLLEIPVKAGETASIVRLPSGWFLGSRQVIAVEVDENGKKIPDDRDARKRNTPSTRQLWRGTEVVGRLLWPDKTPAAGIKLNAGVYVNNQTWKKRLGMDLTWYSFDHGDWANWNSNIVTDETGSFRVTIPPKDARWWFRIGTTSLSFVASATTGIDESTTRRLRQCAPLEIQFGGASARSTIPTRADNSDTDGNVLRIGDVQLESGVIVRGHVVDADGKGLQGVSLTTNGPHGPHSGRRTITGEDGEFEFQAIAAGSLTVHPDARLRDDQGQVKSRDVQAVFIDQSFTIPNAVKTHEIIIGAVPHTQVEFEWIDRRADTSQAIAYYGAFRVLGHYQTGGSKTYWTSETERIASNGKQILFVKMPTALIKPQLRLYADRKATPSYSDSTGFTSGPGTIELDDLTRNIVRTIYGDEPKVKKSDREATISK